MLPLKLKEIVEAIGAKTNAEIYAVLQQKLQNGQQVNVSEVSLPVEEEPAAPGAEARD